MDVKDLKLRIISAGLKAVEELIKVAKEDIIKFNNPEDDLSADKLKNAAATKKLAIFDAFEILSRVESEREALDAIDKGVSKTDTKQGFAERRSK
jgi:hypothetical protein